MKNDEILVEQKDGIAWLTLNRPEKKNAFTITMINELCAQLKKIDFDPQVKIIVLTGAGNCFCAGGDLKAMSECSGMFAGNSFELKNNYEQGIQQIPRTIEALQTPLIAMVNGASVGAGCDLTAMADFRFVSEHASFSVSFAKLGLVPGDGGPYFMSRVVGYAKAMEMYLTGRRYDAASAKAMNLANEVYPAQQLKEEVRKFAKEIAVLPKSAITMTKMALKHSWSHDLNSSLNLLSAYQGIAQRTDAHHDAVRDFFSQS